MNEDALREMVRQAVARRLGAPATTSADAIVTRSSVSTRT